MGIAKQIELEQYAKEIAAAEQKHERGCNLCNNELSREDCESLQYFLDKDD